MGHIAPASEPLSLWTCRQTPTLTPRAKPHVCHAPPDPSLSHEPRHPHLFSSPRIPSQSSILAAATRWTPPHTAAPQAHSHSPLHACPGATELDRAQMTASTTTMAKVQTV